MPRLKPPPGRVASARVAEVPDDDTTDVLDQDQDKQIKGTEDDLPIEEDASVAFQKQIEALKKSEQAAKDRAAQADKAREEALAHAKTREAEVAKLRKETVESQAEAISSALAAAMAEAESAQRDIAAAGEAGDFAAQSVAHRRLAKAEANIARLEDGKAELEERAKAPPVEPERSGDRIDQLPISANAKAFLREKPQYLTNPRLNAKLNAIHYDLLDEGYEPYSDDYIDAVRDRMEPKRQAKIDDDDDGNEPPQPQRRATVSAPVSREAPSSSGTGERPGRITLTVAQKEAAKISGVTEVEYAKNLQRLKNEKANGNYTGGQ